MKSYLLKRVELFKDSSFTFTILMAFFRALAVGMTYVVVSWHLLDLWNSANAVLIFMITWWVGSSVLIPITGWVTDKYSKKNILIICNAARVVIVFIFVVFMEVDNLTNIYIFTSIWGIIYAFTQPATLVIVRELFLNDDKLLDANSTIDATFELGMIFGVSIGGLLISYFNFQNLLYFILCFVAISLFFTLFIKQKRNSHLMNQSENIINSWKLAFKYLSGKKDLITLYCIQSGIMMIFTLAPVFIAPYTKNVLQATAFEFGIIETSFSVGFIIGALLLPYLAEKYSSIKVTIVTLFILSFWYIILASSSSVYVAVISYFGAGLCLANWTLIITLAQKATDISQQGRVMGLFTGIGGIITLSVYYIFYIIGEKYNIPSNDWFYVIAFLAIFISIPLFFNKKEA